jgi:hypothetical protein
MATTLRPSDSCAVDRINVQSLTRYRPPFGFGANAARRFERTCHVLAQLIDTSLMAVFLSACVVQAVLLCFMVAGQTLG